VALIATNITNSAYIESLNPNNTGNTDTLSLGDWDTRILIELPVSNINYISNLTFYFYANQLLGAPVFFSIWNLNSSFDETIVTYNTQPETGTPIYEGDNFNGDTCYSSCGWYSFSFNAIDLALLESKYVIFIPDEYSSSYVGIFSDENGNIELRPYITYDLIQSETFTATGKITFQDVDNTIYNLPNALVYYNSTLYDYTDSNGYYSISGIPNGSVNLFVNKSNAYNIATISVSNTSTIGNAQLLFSKPLLSFPTLSGNYINTNYSHNFKAMNLWENPYFVWGIYTFGTGEIISNQCINSFSTTFQCDLPQNTNATFYFQYSDIYNYNLSNYHPTLTGHRIFNTSSISLLSGQIVNTEESVKSISLLSQEDREAYLSNSLPDMYLIMIIFITICIIISFLKRGKHE